MEIPGIFVKRVAERHNQVRHTAGREDAFNFRHHALRPLDMLKDGVTFDALEHAVAERQVCGIGRHIDAGQSKQIDIHIPGYARPRTAEIKVRPAERRVNIELTRVPDERLGWPEASGNACRPL